MTKDDIQLLYEYDRWANNRVLQAAYAPGDPRLAEAIDIVHSSQRKDGRWSLQHAYKGGRISSLNASARRAGYHPIDGVPTSAFKYRLVIRSRSGCSRSQPSPSRRS